MSNLLLHSPARVIQRILISDGQGTEPNLWLNGSTGSAWPCYSSKEPDRPDEVLTVYDSTGTEDGRSMLDGELFTHYGIQIRVRGATQQIARQKIESVRLYMSETLYNKMINVDGTEYLVQCFSAIKQVLDLKEIPNSKRRLFTINATIPIRRLN